jgi:DUF4097 and DUF4098 domain-containing protein YvlB
VSETIMSNHASRSVIAVGLLLCAVAAFGQNKPEPITVPLSRPGEPVTLEIELMSARIEVIGEDRKDVQLSIAMAGGERRIKTPSGMKTLTGGGALSVEESDNTVSVDSDTHTGKFEVVARVPRRADLHLSTVQDGGIVVRDITGTLELENVNGKIEATNIDGSVIAESVNESIRVAFSSIGKSGATALTSLNGDITVSFPATTGAELRIDNAAGEIESDFDLDVKPTKPTIERNEGRRTSLRVEDVIVATVNGGGPVIKIKTLNGNIRVSKASK